MARTVKQQSLIEQLESLGSIDSRFENIKCINTSITGERKGCLSLIFSADDLAEDKKVALKFIDPEFLGDRYRLAAFNREPEVLNRLKNKRRCLKLIFGPNSFDWQILMPDKSISTLSIDYFVTDWLNEDVEKYFLDQQSYEALIKLQIFRSAVLAVAAFHDEGISHRDIKYDNLRAYKERGELIVIVIDFGTAVHFHNPLATTALDYPQMSVGAPAFSAPEALIGLASHRKLGKLTDIYALGGLLYQMFNRELFGRARAKNLHFETALSFIAAKMAPLRADDEKIRVWANETPQFKYVLEPPKIESPGNNVPMSVVTIISKIHREMTLFDYRDRTQDLQSVIPRIDSAINVLKNHRLDQAKLERKRKLRKFHIEKLRRREQKLAEYLNKNNLLIENVKL